VNGQAEDRDPVPGQYFELRRRWMPGDVIELDLPMPAQLIEAHPLVEEARNQVAVKRGPLVYCLESTDLPAGVTVQEVLLPRDARFEPRFEPGTLWVLLDGVAALEGGAIVQPAGDWAGLLYRELSRSAAHPVRIRLIPYYAWGNRGLSEMTV